VTNTFRYVQSVLLACLILSSGCFAADSQPTDTVGITIAKIVKARDYTAQFVVLAKKSFKEGSPEYNQAFKLYAEAYSDYGAWDAYLADALATGRVKDRKPLPNDSHYDDLSSSATKGATAFVSYVDSNTQGQSKAVVSVLSSLADLGLKLWTGISDKKSKDRTAASKRFSDATAWQSWEQITDGSSPKPAADQSGTDKSKKPTSTKPNTNDKANPNK
jgi:hypothetical protein